MSVIKNHLTMQKMVGRHLQSNWSAGRPHIAFYGGGSTTLKIAEILTLQL
jgi:hypothetical protein